MNITEYKNHYEIYQFSATGVFGYRFYLNDTVFGTASSLVEPTPSVEISSVNYNLFSDFKSPLNVNTGNYRSIINLYDNSIFTNIIYNGKDCFTVQNWNTDILTVTVDNGYEFYNNGVLIAKMSRSEALHRIDNCYYDLIKYFDFFVTDDIGEELLTVLMSFPMLNFVFK